MNVIDLGGFSGCKISLIESDKGNFVRKISSGKSYNERLFKQYQKQATFPNGIIRTPRVINFGYNDEGLFYFDMEYIQGVTLAEYIKTIEIGKIRSLIELIVGGFTQMSSKYQVRCADVTVFSKKVEDLKIKLKGKDQIIDKALYKLENHDWSNFIPSICHGDLTLENIIIKDDEIYLIDFLDSYYDSWLLDIGTLLQDVQAMWAYRNQDNVGMNTIMRLMVFRDLLLEKMEEDVPGYVIEVYYALLQKLVRIFDYTKDKKTYDFLLDKTKMTLEIIEKMEASK